MNNTNRRSGVSRSAVLILALIAGLLMTTVALAQSPQSPEIVGGQEASPGEWPWQVALVQKGSDLYNNQFCGGTLISADWVVTAAHCVDTSGPNDLDVVAGVHDLSNPEPNFQRRTLTQVIVHPDWNDDNFDNDIALLKLSSPINERPASGGTLPIVHIDMVPTSVGALTGANVTVTGWGNRAASPPGGNDFPPRLHEVVVPVVSNPACAAAYASFGDDITDAMLCAGLAQGGKDACQGDSGGPLVYNNSGTWQLAGVVSWGRGCAAPNQYGVYARVSYLRNWVESHTAPPVEVTNWAYFPVVLDVGATVPPPPPPPPPGGGFVNGNFEQGPGAGWSQTSTNDFPLIVNFGNELTPHSGSWAAWLGGYDEDFPAPEQSILGQQVTVPAGQPFLSFYHIIGSEDICGYDFAGVGVNGSIIKQYDLCGDTSTADWVRQTVNLSAFAGQSVLIQFIAETDDLLNSNWFIDDVSFAASAVTNEETASPTAGGFNAAPKSR